MATGKTGGLNWFGVGKPTGSETSATNVLLNRSKRQRQDDALRGQKVGSAAIQSADDWYATAEANRRFRERDGAVGNPFLNPQSLLTESRRQNRSSGIDWSQGDDDKDTGPLRVPGLYWDDPKDFQWDLATLDVVHREDKRQEEPPQEEVQRLEKRDVGLSREELRDVEVAVLELRDKLEADGLQEDAIDAQCDTLRSNLIQQKRRRTPNEKEPSSEAGVDDDGGASSSSSSLQQPEQEEQPRSVVIDDDKQSSSSSSFQPQPSRGVIVDFDDDDDDDDDDVKEEEQPSSREAHDNNNDATPSSSSSSSSFQKQQEPSSRGVVVDFDD